MLLGLDISTAIVGVCFLDDDGGFVSCDFIDLRKKGSMMEKCAVTHDSLSSIVSKDIRHVFIEDRLGNFSFGKTMMQTLMKLAAFNLSVSWMVYDLLGRSIEPHYIHPSTSKSMMKLDGLVIPKGGDKKSLTLEFVKNNVRSFPYTENRNGRPNPQCYDMADSYIIARSGFHIVKAE